MSEFQDRVALVTGGSRGIGRAVALRLAREGADVAFCYAAREDAAAETARAIRALGRRCLAARCDVSDREQVATLVEGARAALGPIDLLVHCGAVSTMYDHAELTWERWREMVDVNLHGCYHVLWAVKDEMIARRFGRIVLLSSVAALAPRQRQIHYSAAKAAVIAMVRCCAEAFGPHNVRINAVAPGLTDTEMAYVLPGETMAAVIQATPMGRMATADEIASVIRFLLSEESSFITGITVVASGGRVMLP